jgi:hypothetical protein
MFGTERTAAGYTGDISLIVYGLFGYR